MEKCKKCNSDLIDLKVDEMILTNNITNINVINVMFEKRYGVYYIDSDESYDYGEYPEDKKDEEDEGGRNM